MNFLATLVRVDCVLYSNVGALAIVTHGCAQSSTRKMSNLKVWRHQYVPLETSSRPKGASLDPKETVLTFNALAPCRIDTVCTTKEILAMLRAIIEDDAHPADIHSCSSSFYQRPVAVGNQVTGKSSVSEPWAHDQVF